MLFLVVSLWDLILTIWSPIKMISFERKLACYHKINELYQNSSLSLFNLMGGILEIVCHGVEAEGGSIWILGEDEKNIIL